MKIINHFALLLLFGCAVSCTQPENSISNESIGIIPLPSTYELKPGTFYITGQSSIGIDKSDPEMTALANYFNEEISDATGFSLPVNNSGTIIFQLGEHKELGEEGYQLSISSDQLILSAYKHHGIFNGIQSVLQLLPPEIKSKTVQADATWSINCIEVTDKPQFAWRGLMLDVSRHFFTKQEVKKFIDQMAEYKYNVFHWHLTDDQGWRLEIKKYPELTLIGGSTEVGGGPGGYYTQEQFKDIVSYAMQRYVEIVPEFDMPGHTNAALASYGFLNPNGKKAPLYTGTDVGFSSFMAHSEKTYEFIEDVIKEVVQISPSKYIQIGGDEALNTKKEDYDYFVGRVAKIAQKYGKIPIGWDPIDTSPEINSSVILQNWKDSNEEAVKKNMKIIVSIASKAYLDMKYNEKTPYGLDWAGYIPVETAYKWDVTDYAPKNLALGLEAPLWTETISTQEQMDYMIYPRLLGYAEIGWTPKENRNWEEYKMRLEMQEERLGYEGVNYYKES